MHPPDHDRISRHQPHTKKTGGGRWARLAIALAVAASIIASPNLGATALRKGKSHANPSPIRHIVVIVQENHSFDNVLGKLCLQAAKGKVNRSPCDGTAMGQLPDGSPIPLSRTPDVSPGVHHSVEAQQMAMNGGKMNGFALIHGCTRKSDPPYGCYSQYEPSQIPNAAALATAFAVSDRTFEFRETPSWAGHMVLGSATLDGFQGNQPQESDQVGAGGNGCDSLKDARWLDRKRRETLVPSCIPDVNGNGPYPWSSSCVPSEIASPTPITTPPVT